jgi:NADH dehydrogenase
MAFEKAERETDPAAQRACLTFVVVGGGPTGVELAGALAELAHGTLRNDFRNVDPTKARILLVEGADRILPVYHPSLSAKAEESLNRLDVEVCTNTLVTDIKDGTVTLQKRDQTESFPTCAVLWAAGMRADPMGQIVAQRTNAESDRMGRVIVNPDLSVSRNSEIYVIGDLAHCVQDGETLPGVAPVAMQQGRYMARVIEERLQGNDPPPFHYRDKGSLAVIGRNAAVAQMGKLRFSGLVAWLLWVFIHIAYLIEFDNRLLVLFQWAWNYVTRRRGARLITEGPNPF